jgi:hypothetical protein
LEKESGHHFKTNTEGKPNRKKNAPIRNLFVENSITRLPCAVRLCLLALLLERSWPNEYARTERIEQVNEQADDKNPLVILYNTRGQQLSALLDFPIHSSMKQGHDSPHYRPSAGRLESGSVDS